MIEQTPTDNLDEWYKALTDEEKEEVQQEIGEMIDILNRWGALVSPVFNKEMVNMRDSILSYLKVYLT